MVKYTNKAVGQLVKAEASGHVQFAACFCLAQALVGEAFLSLTCLRASELIPVGIAIMKSDPVYSSY